MLGKIFFIRKMCGCVVVCVWGGKQKKRTIPQKRIAPFDINKLISNIEN